MVELIKKERVGIYTYLFPNLELAKRGLPGNVGYQENWSFPGNVGYQETYFL
jgi:hypothetical protein